METLAVFDVLVVLIDALGEVTLVELNLAALVHIEVARHLLEGDVGVTSHWRVSFGSGARIWTLLE